MKKKIISLILASIFGITTLTSCGFLLLDESESLPPVPGADESIPEGSNYYRAGRSVDTYYSLGQHSLYGQSVPKSLGEQKTIVVPVAIKGYEQIATEAVRARIEKAFFGTEEETGWESVTSFFKKSSFNQLNISGVVTDWYSSGLTPAQIASKDNPTYGDGGTYFVLRGVYNWLLNQHFPVDEYDLDNDGYIDSIWMIYGCPNYTNSVSITSDTFWAFSFVDYEYLELADEDVPVPNTYAWASFDFMNSGKSAGISIDAHTYIHEHGHNMGLEDYYDYDKKHDPLGKIDMQDCNVGDHNAYTKMAFGWSTPYVVTGECTITIGAAESTGQCILVTDPNKPYNGNAFSEYLLLELLTPTGLWKQDATNSYPSLGQKTFTRAGVRMLHIDSRLVDHNNKFADKTSNRSIYGLAYSNTPSQSYSKGSGGIYDDLIAFIPSSNSRNELQNSFDTSSTVTYQDLFNTGDSFNISSYTNFFRNGKLHDGSTIPYSITIDEVTSNSATISFKVK